MNVDDPDYLAELASCRALIARAQEQLARADTDVAGIELVLADLALLTSGLQRLRGLGQRSPATPELRALPIVLIVEDQEDNRIIYRRTLRKSYELVEVEDGLSAIERAHAIRPALIVMDISLPVMDGIEATRLLKRDAVTAAIPIVLVTAHAMKGNREEALASGADEYITKPFSPAQLREVLQRFIG